MKPNLTLKHVERFMRQYVAIGNGTTKEDLRKDFVYCPWDDEFTVFNNGRRVESGRAIEELLEVYNQL